MIVKNIEQRIKVNKAVSLACIIFSIVVVIAGFFFSYQLVEDSRKSIYVLDNGVPVLVQQQDLLLNREVEYRSQVEYFHRLFFTLVPDDEYIRNNTERSLYLIDDSGKKEYANLREKGYYNQIVSSNASVSVQVDSIKINTELMKFQYFGKQIISRRSSVVIRNLITEGGMENMARTVNNGHGVKLLDWRILDNGEISNKKRY
ncbi:Bacteroides conjugative transposon TraK protein [Candidatus Ornithobacterium hominis]|uniref:Bacteroides conjugative transposon TraK protein n=1 Tax=Candidatus Ornithobacterium hominis TaxID=2497989 RepID=A0A383U3U4_9FLAO|nr:conjugative transposon protein TraK [Candidatus Ornithobacterium hominis]MCT7905126.1 conjugative transposon protein TraK [Candidatus Ornithobacterium hominis]SZD74210.1 Bacteroides conjugative transposon TraK protein [Candidatus Ornithobacterium hominis]